MTPQEGVQLQIKCYRRMMPQQRLDAGFRLYALTRTLVRQGVKFQHPDWSDEQVRQEVLRRFRIGAGIPSRCGEPD
jgi:hypothetical protein